MTKRAYHIYQMNSDTNENGKDNDKKDNTTLHDRTSDYKYIKKDVDNFFASDNRQEEEYELEESICWPLVGVKNQIPFFKYCKRYVIKWNFCI